MSQEETREWFVFLRRLVTYFSVFVVNLIIFALGAVLMVFTQPPVSQIGIAMTASGIVGWISFYVFKVQYSFHEGVERIQDWGLREVYPHRSEFDMYDKRLTDCDMQVDILAKSLSRFFQDFKEVLPKLAKKGVKIRILLLDPDSPQARARELEEANERSGLCQRIREQTRNFQGLKLTNMEIRWYNCTPSINYFRIDNHIYFGSYFVGLASRNSLTFLGRATEKIAKPYVAHFERVWDQFSREAPRDDERPAQS